MSGGGVTQFRAPASNRKIVKPWFDSLCGSTSLCPWERHLRYIPSWSQAVYPLWWPSLTKDMLTEQRLLCWSGMTDTEHTISDSNEEVYVLLQIGQILDLKFVSYSILQIVSWHHYNLL